MRLWPFNRRETRGYTEVAFQSIYANATGEVSQGLTAGVEIAAGHWQRAFASADLTPAGVLADALGPYLGYIGRELVQQGEAIFALDFSDGLTLIPASSAKIAGGPLRSSWTYELTLAGPSSTHTQRPLRSDSVLHLFYARGARNPWRGISPIEASQTTRKLLDNLEFKLAQEAGTPVGQVVPVPNVESSGQLQTDLRALDGGLALVESTAQNWGSGGTGAPPSDFGVKRLGADPPVALSKLRREAEESILASGWCTR